MEDSGGRPNRKGTKKQQGSQQRLDDGANSSQDPRYDCSRTVTELALRFPPTFPQQPPQQEEGLGYRFQVYDDSTQNLQSSSAEAHKLPNRLPGLLKPNRSLFSSIVGDHADDHGHHSEDDDVDHQYQDALPTPFHPAIGRPTSIIMTEETRKQPGTAWRPKAESALIQQQYHGGGKKNVVGDLHHRTNLSASNNREEGCWTGARAQQRPTVAGRGIFFSRDEPSGDNIMDGFGIQQPRMGDNSSSEELDHDVASPRLAQHMNRKGVVVAGTAPSQIQEEQQDRTSMLLSTSASFPQVKPGYYYSSIPAEGSTSLSSLQNKNEQVYIPPLPLSAQPPFPAVSNTNNSVDWTAPMQWASMASEQHSTIEDRISTPRSGDEIRHDLEPNAESEDGSCASFLKPLNSRNFFYAEMRDWLLRLDDWQLRDLVTQASASTAPPAGGNSYIRATLLAHTGNQSREARMQHLLSSRLTKAQRKRKHRKVHGKLSFHQMNSLIDSEWRMLPEAEKEFYKDVARADKARFERELQLSRNLPQK